MSTRASSGDGSSNQGQLRELAVLANDALTVVASSCYSIVSYAARWSFAPFVLVYPPISYLIAPLVVFVAMVINISVLAPLNVARYLLSSLYPVYVFCGVACITGIAAGVSGRGISTLLAGMFAKSEQDGPARTDVPAARGIGRRSRRRLRTKDEDT